MEIEKIQIQFRGWSVYGQKAPEAATTLKLTRSGPVPRGETAWEALHALSCLIPYKGGAEQFSKNPKDRQVYNMVVSKLSVALIEPLRP